MGFGFLVLIFDCTDDYFVRLVVVRLHYSWIDIGMPKVPFLVALDTGSDLLWVPCDCVQCAPLSASYYNTLVSLFSFFLFFFKRLFAGAWRNLMSKSTNLIYCDSRHFPDIIFTLDLDRA